MEMWPRKKAAVYRREKSEEVKEMNPGYWGWMNVNPVIIQQDRDSRTLYGMYSHQEPFPDAISSLTDDRDVFTPSPSI